MILPLTLVHKCISIRQMHSGSFLSVPVGRLSPVQCARSHFHAPPISIVLDYRCR